MDYRLKVVDLKKALLALEEADNPLLPESAKFNAVLVQCTKLLKSEGYPVLKKVRSSGEIKNIKDLVEYYYAQLVNRTNITPYRNDKTDLSIAKRLVKQVQFSTGYTDEAALSKCIEIVRGIFTYSSELNLKPETMVSFSIFGQDKLAWITQRIIELINRDANDEARLIAQADREAEVYLKTSGIELGWDDLDELVERLDKEK